MKKVLVTGAAGYLGASICLCLKEMGYHVYALCRSLPENINNAFKDIQIIEGDLTDQETLDSLANLNVDSVVHTVSLDHRLSQTSSVEDVNKTNVLATWKLLDAFTKMKIEKFIFLSTIQVIGKSPLGTISEKNLKAPDNVYGLTHSIGEDLINYYNQQSDTHCVTLRLSNGYGAPVFEENNCWWLIVNDLCRSAYYNKKIVLNTDGKPLRDFIHVKDISMAVGFVLKEAGLSDPLFNVSSGQTRSILEIAHIIKLIYERRYKTAIPVYYSGSVISEKVPEFSVDYIIDNQKLLSFGFNPEISIEEGIDDLFLYFDTLNNNDTQN